MCRMTPGSAMDAWTYEVPPARCGRSTARDSISTLSTPFWNGMTTVSAPMSGGSSGIADSVSYSFTANNTTSTAPTVDASSVAETRGR